MRECERLITSLPNKVAVKVYKKISEDYGAGRRPENIRNDLMREFPKMTRSKAGLIARTESSKASTALTRARMADVGFMWYVWKTSRDSRVRSSHSHMDGVLVNWNDPPCTLCTRPGV